MATEYVDPSGLEALLSNRLIPLDKCPGLRPIGIGETARRIIAKTLVNHFKTDIQQAAGALRLCAGQKAGCEAAIHSITTFFQADTTDALLLIDADNAFNRLNRSAALWNIQFICPPISIFAINCYRVPSRLFVLGGAEISSSEGTTQGDPLAMPFYALAMTPFIRRLHGIVQQVWYADDAQAAGKLSSLRQWWDIVLYCIVFKFSTLCTWTCSTCISTDNEHTSIAYKHTPAHIHIQTETCFSYIVNVEMMGVGKKRGHERKKKRESV
jgi:hypothetical protein